MNMLYIGKWPSMSTVASRILYFISSLDFSIVSNSIELFLQWAFKASPETIWWTWRFGITCYWCRYGAKDRSKPSPCPHIARSEAIPRGFISPVYALKINIIKEIMTIPSSHWMYSAYVIVLSSVSRGINIGVYFPILSLSFICGISHHGSNRQISLVIRGAEW